MLPVPGNGIDLRILLAQPGKDLAPLFAHQPVDLLIAQGLTLSSENRLPKMTSAASIRLR
jgi:hypothetical protein